MIARVPSPYLGTFLSDAWDDTGGALVSGAADLLSSGGDIAANYFIHGAAGPAFASSNPELARLLISTNWQVDWKKTVKGAIAIAESLTSLLPGVGPAIAGAIAGGIGLALGERIDDALIEAATAAVPGGPLAAAAFKSAATFGTALARGEPLDQAGLEATRAAVGQAGGPAAQAAFEGGLALAQGKSLQEAGFASAHGLMRGNTLADKAIGFAEKAATAAQRGTSVPELLEQEVVSEVGQLAPAVLSAGLSQLRPLASQIAGSPELLALSSDELAARVGIAEPLARMVLGSVVPAPSTGGGFISSVHASLARARVDQDRLNRMIAQAQRAQDIADALAASRVLQRIKSPAELAELAEVERLITRPGMANRPFQEIYDGYVASGLRTVFNEDGTRHAPEFFIPATVKEKLNALVRAGLRSGPLETIDDFFSASTFTMLQNYEREKAAEAAAPPTPPTKAPMNKRSILIGAALAAVALFLVAES